MLVLGNQERQILPITRTICKLSSLTQSLQRGWCLALAFILFVLCGIGEPIHYYLHAVSAAAAQKTVAATHLSATSATKNILAISAVVASNHHSCALCAFATTPRLVDAFRIGLVPPPVSRLSPGWLARAPSTHIPLCLLLLRSRAPPVVVA